MRTKVSQVFLRAKLPLSREAYPGAQAGLAPVTPHNDAAAYGVEIQPAAVPPGGWYWQAAWVHHLTPDENVGKHHIYMDLYESVQDEQQRWKLQQLRGGELRVTWQDHGEEIVTIEKPAGEPGTNMPLWREQICTVWALGLPGAQLPSDAVTGIHTNHPVEGTGNSPQRHSFSIVFQKVQAPAVEPGAPKAGPVLQYVLFGPADNATTLTNLWLAQDYLLAFRPAFGFNPDEAARADLITIVANEPAVGPEIEESLTAAGARVERIKGDVTEVADELAQRVARGAR
jgi:hypothetical protein